MLSLFTLLTQQARVHVRFGQLKSSAGFTYEPIKPLTPA